MRALVIEFDPLYGLLKKAVKGDKNAAKSLVTSLSPKLFRIAYRMLNNTHDAEEIVQEILVKIWNIAPNWQENNAKLETWAFRVTTNLCIDKIRKSTKFKTEELDETYLDKSINQENLIIASEMKQKVAMALEELPPRQKAALILSYFEGKSQKEVAHILETSIEAVESLLGRGKKALKSMLISQKDEIFDDFITSNVYN